MSTRVQVLGMPVSRMQVLGMQAPGSGRVQMLKEFETAWNAVEERRFSVA